MNDGGRMHPCGATSGEEAMDIHFLGCGDAFGSGGRFNTCFHVTGDRANFLIDCGASTMIALRQRKIDPNTIELILITHFHADHFGGLPFFMLDAQFFSKRGSPLTITGPAGIMRRYRTLAEAMFPGSSSTTPGFPLEFVELEPERSTRIGALAIRAFDVNHGNEGGPFLGYRITLEGRTIAYTGDTEWTEALVTLAHQADLLIAEAYFRDKQVKLHLDFASLEANLGRMNPKQVVLTHMSPDMIGRSVPPPFQQAYDGLRLTL